MKTPMKIAGYAALSVAVALTLAEGCGGGGGGGKPRALEILTPSLLPAAEALPYSFQLDAQGGRKPYTWDLSQGTLPAGLSLDAASGIISGTPASGESASSPFAIQIRVTDGKAANPDVVTRDYSLIVDPPGGIGGGQATGTITVVVLEEETSQPIQGAFVMIGPAADNPFTGNFGTTDAAGVATFTDPALNMPVPPPVVTAGATGRQYMSIYGANASQFVLPLKPIVSTATKSRISGHVTGQNTAINNLYAAVVIPPVHLSELFKLRLENLILGEECVCLVCAKLLLPGNLSYPQQDLTPIIDGDDVPEKAYFIDLEDGTQVHLAAAAGFIDEATLMQFISGGNPNRIELFTQLQVEGFGVVLDYPVTGPATVDVPITIAPDPTPVDVTILRTPRGTDAFIIAGADLDAAGGAGQMIASDFGFVARDQTLPQTEALTAVPDTMPGVGAPDRVSVAVAFFDPYSGIAPAPTTDVENAYSFVADRTTPFTNPGGITFESFMDLMPLDPTVNIGGGNRTFTFPSALDAGNPTSPEPSYSLSQIARVWEITPAQPPDPFPGQYCPPTGGILITCDDIPGGPPACPPPSNVTISETYWEVYTRGSTTDTTFDLPTLPPSAPRAADEGLFDPSVTPEQDVRRWTVFSFYAGIDPTFSFDRFTFGSMDDLTTHVSLNFVQY